MSRLKLLLPAGILLALAVLGRPVSAQTDTDWRFGVIESYTAPNSARELGVAWTRVRFQWADTQATGPDSFTPQVSDALIEQELAAGRLVVGLLIGIPDWARAEDGLPTGLWREHDDPGNSWAQFVRETVGRYQGRIDHWVIWNEPDIDDTAVAHSWDGSVEDFYQLQRVAYLVAKETNPQSTVHLSAFTYWADAHAGREQYIARLLDRIMADPQAAGNHYYFDIATAHLYFQPDQIYDLLLLFQDIMAERDIHKPIWLVETNAPPHDDPAWLVPDHTLSVLQDEQAAFMPQMLAIALAAGADRVGVYKMQDTPADRKANPEPFGLLRMDGSRRPAFRALNVAMQNMRGATSVIRERWDAVGQFRIEQPDRVTTLLFSRLASAQQVEVEAIADSAWLVDLRGTRRVIEAENGRFLIDLTPALCTQTIGDFCMIGGGANYVVQAKDGGPPPEAPPPILPTPTVTPTRRATATPTPSVTPLSTATTTAIPTLPTATVTATPSQVPTATLTEAPLMVAVTAMPDIESSQPPAAGRSPGPPSIVAGAFVLLILFVIGWLVVTRRT